MQRILEPGQIETLVQRSVPRIRPPGRDTFAARGARLRTLADGHAIGDYLRLMATLAEAQQAAFDDYEPALPDAERFAQARAHGMPLAPAGDGSGDGAWREMLTRLCDGVATQPACPAGVAALCARLRAADPAELDAQAAALLGGEGTAADVDAAAAPFVMAALQVRWTALASRLAADDLPAPAAPGLCLLCGMPPVASVVHTGGPYQGYRYLHCALCASEWHMVRGKCSDCDNGKGIGYQAIEGGSEAVKAESCDACRGYRKILYQDKDAGVEPVADDLATLALDLLMGEAGYHRLSGNPLLWQGSTEA